MSLMVIAFVLMGQAPFEASASAIDRDKLVTLLHAESARFRERPSMRYSFVSDYTPGEGDEEPVHSRPGKKEGESRTGEIRWDGDQAETILVDFLTDLSGDPASGSEGDGSVLMREEQSVWKDGRRLGLRHFADTERDQPFTTEQALHDGVRPDMDGWFADGVLFDSDHFADAMLQANDLEGSIVASDGGSERIQIIGTTASGLMTVWLDAEEPHLLRRAQFEAGPEFVAKHKEIEAATIDVTINEYVEEEGFFIASAADAVYSYAMSDFGRTTKKRISTKRSSITINPDFESLDAFQIDFAEGTKISNYDVPSLPFVWLQGELRPYVDQAIDSSIESIETDWIGERTVHDKASGDEESASASHPQSTASEAEAHNVNRDLIVRRTPYIEIAAVVAAVAAVLGLMWYKRRNR